MEEANRLVKNMSVFLVVMSLVIFAMDDFFRSLFERLICLYEIQISVREREHYALSASSHASAAATAEATATTEASVAATATAETSAAVTSTAETSAAVTSAAAYAGACGRRTCGGCCARGGGGAPCISGIVSCVSRIIEARGRTRCECSVARNASALHVAARGCATLSEVARGAIGRVAQPAIVVCRTAYTRIA